MTDTNREIPELLIDYAGALRDGCIPAFLKSLSQEESGKISCSSEFRDAAQTARALNVAGFADKVVAPDVGLFISRVDAAIATRQKKALAYPPHKRAKRTRSKRNTETRTDELL